MRDAGPSTIQPGADAASQLPVAQSRRPKRSFLLDARARREIVVALALLFCYGFFRQVPAWNEYSRYDLVRALVEDGTTRIDRYHENTGDKAYYQGHFYSDKAPGTAILGVPIYGLLILTSEVAGSDGPDPQTAIQVLAFAISGIPTVVLVLLLLRFLHRAVGERWALVVSLGYGLGSIAFPFATMFFGHAASAFLLFASFYLLWRWRADRQHWRPWLAGFLAACAVITEIPVVIGVAVLGVYALWLGRAQLFRFALGGIPVLLVLATYNWLTFGSPFSLGYQYATAFSEQNSQGIVSIVWPSLTTTFDLLFSPRGLLRLAPWFCVAPFGVLAYRRRAVRAEVVVAVAICGAFVAYNSGALNAFGGWTPGPRYLLPALPFAAILVALAPSVLRPVVALQIAVAVALVLVATMTMPNAPEAFGDPLIQLWLPRLLSRDIAETLAWTRWGFHGIQPLLVLALGTAIAGTAALATTRPGVAARRLSGGLVGVLVILVVAFAVPLPTVRALDLLVGGPSTDPARLMAIVDVGATPVRTEREVASILWAHVENRGIGLAGTRVTFNIYTPDGQLTWSAWHDDVAWGQGERKRMTVQWDTAQVRSGDYTFEVVVVSSDPQTSWTNRSGVLSVRR